MEYKYDTFLETLKFKDAIGIQAATSGDDIYEKYFITFAAKAKNQSEKEYLAALYDDTTSTYKKDFKSFCIILKQVADDALFHKGSSDLEGTNISSMYRNTNQYAITAFLNHSEKLKALGNNSYSPLTFDDVDGKSIADTKTVRRFNKIDENVLNKVYQSKLDDRDKSSTPGAPGSETRTESPTPEAPGSETRSKPAPEAPGSETRSKPAPEAPGSETRSKPAPEAPAPLVFKYQPLRYEIVEDYKPKKIEPYNPRKKHNVVRELPLVATIENPNKDDFVNLLGLQTRNIFVPERSVSNSYSYLRMGGANYNLPTFKDGSCTYYSYLKKEFPEFFNEIFTKDLDSMEGTNYDGPLLQCMDDEDERLFRGLVLYCDCMHKAYGTEILNTTSKGMKVYSEDIMDCIQMIHIALTHMGWVLQYVRKDETSFYLGDTKRDTIRPIRGVCLWEQDDKPIVFMSLKSLNINKHIVDPIVHYDRYGNAESRESSYEVAKKVFQDYPTSVFYKLLLQEPYEDISYGFGELPASEIVRHIRTMS
jgi:hypothetical protein